MYIYKRVRIRPPTHSRRAHIQDLFLFRFVLFEIYVFKKKERRNTVRNKERERKQIILVVSESEEF